MTTDYSVLLPCRFRPSVLPGVSRVKDGVSLFSFHVLSVGGGFCPTPDPTTQGGDERRTGYDDKSPPLSDTTPPPLPLSVSTLGPSKSGFFVRGPRLVFKTQ